MIQFRWAVWYIILIEFGKANYKCVNEIYSRVQVDKDMSTYFL